MPRRYEIRFAGRPDDTARDAFAGLELVTDGTVTVISGDFDQAALHGLLERLRVLGLDVIEVRRARRQPGG